MGNPVPTDRLFSKVVRQRGLVLTFLVCAATTALAQGEVPVYGGKNKEAIPYTNSGAALLKKGDDAGAMVDLNRAIQIDPTMWPAYLARGQVFVKQGKWSLALDDLNTAAQLKTDFDQIFVVRASVHAHFHQAVATIADLDTALKLSRESESRAEMLNLRAWIRATATDAGLRDGSQAVADATEACKTKSENPEFIDTLAVAYGETGDFNSAIRSEERALQIGGSPDEIRKQLQNHLAAFKRKSPIRDPSWK